MEYNCLAGCLFVNVIARIILFCKILVILVIRGAFISGGLSDFRGFILVILVIRGDMNACCCL